MGNSQGLDGNSGKYSSSNLTAKDESMPLRDELEESFAKLVVSLLIVQEV